ncbi:MAG: metallophosphoesterase family protein [Bacteroidota bacterium]|nr:metallophosphoesterase family protein [Bacteroidota bacterium]
MKRSEKEEQDKFVWKSTRANLEAHMFKNKRSGKKSKSHWNLFVRLVHVFEYFLKIFGLYEKGIANARDIKIVNHTLYFENLPKAFEGFKVLHLSDLHINSLPGIEKSIIEKIKSVEYDLCVMTGDYRKNTFGSFKDIIIPMYKIIKNINSNYKILGVLGNHDTYLMVEHAEELKIRMLVNESIDIKKDNEKITITGTDDPFAFYSDMAVYSLEKTGKGFKIALVHTSELADIAAENNYSLYLCGHTHGGQICFPSGKPIITHQFEGKKFVSGLWNYNGMQGYTSKGCGVSGIPVRYNCNGEITVFTLRKK